jgi:N-acetyl-gamma-glutamyl-phosphate reductase/acetylglutamate kinase
VAEFFRGISLTVDVTLSKTISESTLRQLYADAYANEPLVQILDSSEGGCKDGVPLVRDNANRHHVALGGFRVHNNRVVMIATLDNLLKGAATQCLQNINLSLGLNEFTGIPQ